MIDETISLKNIGGKKTEQEYSDGPVEDELLKLVRSPNFAEKRQDILKNNPSWPMLYHLSPVRSNLVNWYDFDHNSTILEIGAGCGAITEALLENIDESITLHALELSKRRAKINAHRNKSYSNLEVLVGNMEHLGTSKKYDYIVCVGVLEYAGKYISGADPFNSFLANLQSLLNPGGELLLAIENKLGLKYISGSREDHTGLFFESLMSYPQYKGIRTFSKSELVSMLEAAKFTSTEFYFPIPDYKLPQVVLSESAFDIMGSIPSIITPLHPAPSPDQSRSHVASEQLFANSLVDAKLYPHTANSFLVKATK